MSNSRRASRMDASITARALRLANRLGFYLLHDEDEETSDADAGHPLENSDNPMVDDKADSENDDCGNVVGHEQILPSSQEHESSNGVTALDGHLAHVTKLGTAASRGTLACTRSRKSAIVNTATILAGRQCNMSGIGKFSRAECCHLSARYLPEDGPVVVQRMNSRAYIGQFSDDGTLFVAGYQDRRIQIYDVDRGWRLCKDIIARNLQWTITDTSLSPDRRFLVYASITPIVHLVNINNETCGIESLANVTDIHEGLNFASDDDEAFGIWSLQFSSDGREIVAGSNDNSIYVYDLEANRTVFRITAHKDEVNAVRFADNSSHLIFSGSDDHFCKVWDRRCFGGRSKCVGKLVGHLEGITFIDSRGDGRYFISNAKDQSIKLWDIRKMSGGPPLSTRLKSKVPSFRWDYRYMNYPGADEDIRHPHDQSLMTYKGHAVLRTLIRCYFSPAFSTGQKYIYTGSWDGYIYIYDLITSKLISKLVFHQTTVRDCSWHPWQPMLVSASWDGKIARWDHCHG